MKKVTGKLARDSSYALKSFPFFTSNTRSCRSAVITANLSPDEEIERAVGRLLDLAMA